MPTLTLKNGKKETTWTTKTYIGDNNFVDTDDTQQLKKLHQIVIKNLINSGYNVGAKEDLELQSSRKAI